MAAELTEAAEQEKEIQGEPEEGFDDEAQAEEMPVFFSGEADAAEEDGYLAVDPEPTEVITGTGTVFFNHYNYGEYNESSKFIFCPETDGTYSFSTAISYGRVGIGKLFNRTEQALKMIAGTEYEITVDGEQCSDIDVTIQRVEDIQSVNVTGMNLEILLEQVGRVSEMNQNTRIFLTLADGSTEKGTLGEGVPGYGKVEWTAVDRNGTPIPLQSGKNRICFYLPCDSGIKSESVECTGTSIENWGFNSLNEESLLPYVMKQNYTSNGRAYICFLYKNNGMEIKRYQGILDNENAGTQIYKKNQNGMYESCGSGTSSFIINAYPGEAFFVYAELLSGAQNAELTLEEIEAANSLALTEEGRNMLASCTFVKELFNETSLKKLPFVITYENGEEKGVTLAEEKNLHIRIDESDGEGAVCRAVYDERIESEPFTCVLEPMEELDITELTEEGAETVIPPLSEAPDVSVFKFTAKEKGHYYFKCRNVKEKSENFDGYAGRQFLNGESKAIWSVQYQGVNVELDAGETVYYAFEAMDAGGIRITAENKTLESITLIKGNLETEYLRGYLYHKSLRNNLTFAANYTDGTQEILLGVRSKYYGSLKMEGLYREKEGEHWAIDAGEKLLRFKFEGSEISYDRTISVKEEDMLPSVLNGSREIPENCGGMHSIRIPVEQNGSYEIKIDASYANVWTYTDGYDEWIEEEEYFGGNFREYGGTSWRAEYEAGTTVYVLVDDGRRGNSVNISVKKAADVTDFRMVSPLTPVYLRGTRSETMDGMEFELTFEDGRKERFRAEEGSAYYGHMGMNYSWSWKEETGVTPYLEFYFYSTPNLKMKVPVELQYREDAEIPVIRTMNRDYAIGKNFNNSSVSCFVSKKDGYYQVRTIKNGTEVRGVLELIVVEASGKERRVNAHTPIQLNRGEKLYIFWKDAEGETAVRIEEGKLIQSIELVGDPAAFPRNYVHEIVRGLWDVVEIYQRYWQDYRFKITFSDGSTQTVNFYDEEVDGYGKVWCRWPGAAEENLYETVEFGMNKPLSFEVNGCRDKLSEPITVNIIQAEDLRSDSSEYQAYLKENNEIYGFAEGSTKSFAVEAPEEPTIYELEFTDDIFSDSEIPAAFAAEPSEEDAVWVDINGKAAMLKTADGKIRLQLQPNDKVLVEYFGERRGVKRSVCTETIDSIELLEGQKILYGDTGFDISGLKFRVTLSNGEVLDSVSAKDNIAGFGSMELRFGEDSSVSSLPVGKTPVTCNLPLLDKELWFEAGQIEVVGIFYNNDIKEAKLNTKIVFKEESSYNGQSAVKISLDEDRYYQYRVTGTGKRSYISDSGERKEISGTEGVILLTAGAYMFLADSGAELEITEIDKKALEELCGNRKEKKEDYTAGSWAVYEAALAEAKEALENPRASQSVIDSAADKLKNAVKELEKIHKPVYPVPTAAPTPTVTPMPTAAPTPEPTVTPVPPAEDEKVGVPQIKKAAADGNKVTVYLEGAVKAAEGYDFVISKSKNCIKEKKYADIRKNITDTKTEFCYVPKGTYYVYCHAWKKADGKKVFGAWSAPYKFKVSAVTLPTPKITSVNVKGRTVTVKLKQSKSSEGMDVVLAKAVSKDSYGLRPVQYGKLVKKNKKGTTVIFTNVPKGTYYVGVHSFNRTGSGGKKVFSRWAVSRKIKVK